MGQARRRDCRGSAGVPVNPLEAVLRRLAGAGPTGHGGPGRCPPCRVGRSAGRDRTARGRRRSPPAAGDRLPPRSGPAAVPVADPGRADLHRSGAAVVHPAGDRHAGGRARRRRSARPRSPTCTAWSRDGRRPSASARRGDAGPPRAGVASWRSCAQHDRLFEYVASEVLGAVDDDLRSVLIQISVLDRMTPELIEALTGRGDAHDLLAGMERATSIVRAGRRSACPWYRFHPLLRPCCTTSCAQRRARTAAGAARPRVPVYFEHAAAADAIRHALAARNWNRAAALVGGLAGRRCCPGSRQRRCRPWCRCRRPRRSRTRGWRWPSRPNGSTPPTRRRRRVPPHRAARPGPTPRPLAVMTAFRIAHAYQTTSSPRRRTSPRRPSRSGRSTRAGGLVGPRGARRRVGPALRRRHRGGRAAAVAQPRLAEQRGMTQSQITGCASSPCSTWCGRRSRRRAVRQPDAGSRLPPPVGRRADTFWAELVLAEVCYQQDRTTRPIPPRPCARRRLPADSTPAGVVAMVRARIGATTGQPRAALARLAAARRQLRWWLRCPRWRAASCWPRPSSGWPAGDAHRVPAARRVLARQPAAGLVGGHPGPPASHRGPLGRRGDGAGRRSWRRPTVAALADRGEPAPRSGVAAIGDRVEAGRAWTGP